MTIVSYSWMVLHFCCLFSYPSLLELHYRGKLRKSQTAREQAREMRLLVREAEWRIDAELFLDEYPRWELGGPHWSIILHAVECRQKEAERLICQGCMRQHIKTWPRGWPICHGTHGVPDLSQGDSRHLPQCLSVEKASRSPTLWVSMEKESNLWHPLLPKKPVALVGVSCHGQRSTSVDLGLVGETHMRKSSGRSGQLAKRC